MAKNRALDDQTFYLLRFKDNEEAMAFKLMMNAPDGQGTALMRSYEIHKGACTCAGSKRGPCRHELMVRSRENYREFPKGDVEPMKVYIGTRLGRVIDGLEFVEARQAKHKEEMFESLLFRGKLANEEFPQLRRERRVLVAFFDPRGLGVPYVKAVVLLQDWEASKAPDYKAERTRVEEEAARPEDEPQDDDMPLTTPEEAHAQPVQTMLEATSSHPNLVVPLVGLEGLTIEVFAEILTAVGEAITGVLEKHKK